MSDTKYTWIQTHKDINKYLLTFEDDQKGLIILLKSIGITGFTDQKKDGNTIDLDEIDPFTFYCYIYKYGVAKRLENLQKIAEKINAHYPTDECGIPSAQAQQVWLFPYEYKRVNNEVKRLWSFFKNELNGQITNEDFADLLNIEGIGKSKLTEALFNVNPEKYLPINNPTKLYLKEELGINPEFNTYSEYLNILENIRSKTSEPFFEISYKAWEWKTNRKQISYWIFQCDPNSFDFEKAIRNNLLDNWTISQHKNKIHEGDKAIIWVSGKKSGCYALAEVISDPNIISDSKDSYLWKKENKNSLKAGIKITHNLIDSPILNEVIKATKGLSDLKAGNQGTNFSATEKEYNTLLKLADKRYEKKYWLYAPGENARLWEEFYEQGIMGLGWDQIGDLNNFNSKEEIRKKLQEIGETDSSNVNDTLSNYEFKEVLSIGDIVIPKRGRKEYLGYGIVTSHYYYDTNRKTFQKCRRVEWKKKGYWEEEEHPIVVKTLTDITKYPEYVNRLIELIGIEQNNEMNMTFPLNVILYGPPGTGKTYHTILKAAEIIEEREIKNYGEALKIFKDNLHDRIEFITFHQNYSYEDFIQGLRPEVDNKASLTFDKKDGVFKKIADRAYENIMLSKKAPEDLTKEIQFDNALEKFSEIVQESEDRFPINSSAYIMEVEDDAFRYTGSNWERHANGLRMKFNDLREFYRNDIQNRKDIKELKTISGLANQHSTYYLIVYNKILEQIPKKMDFPKKVDEKNYVIVIDEINRANISRVFGELITLIEPDKRSHGKIPMEAKLPSGDIFIVPSNLYLIGTMNTADKSIALLDIALRRRFEFEPMYPKYSIDGHEVFDKDVLENINTEIIKSKGHDFQIGHSYFMNENKDLVQRMNKKVIPLLLEYYMNDKKEVVKILETSGLKIEENSWPIKITGRS